MRLIRQFLANTDGATAIEYGLIIAVLSLVVIAGVSNVGEAIQDMFGSQDRELQKAFK